ncbi:MAG: hypothetical protein M1365_11030, partial [Actinobacteria bacterium]|nr:hypothetical protein [Actinomycetota bacterium]
GFGSGGFSPGHFGYLGGLLFLRKKKSGFGAKYRGLHPVKTSCWIMQNGIDNFKYVCNMELY